MTTLEVKLDLPEGLAREAQQAGLLTPQAVESMLRERLRVRRIAELRESVTQRVSAGTNPLTSRSAKPQQVGVRSALLPKEIPP
jgi:hypothetical protein